MGKNGKLAGAAFALAAVLALGTPGVASAATGVGINETLIAESFVNGSFSAGANSDAGRSVWAVSGTWVAPHPATVVLTQKDRWGNNVPVEFWRVSGGTDATGLSWTIYNGSLVAGVSLPAGRSMFELRVESPGPDEIFAAHLIGVDDQLLVESPVGAGIVVERTLH